MKKYIGVIRLSEEDAKSWYKNPKTMYVTSKEGKRHKMEDAKLFESKEQCIKALRREFKEFGHDKYNSRMEVMEITMTVSSVNIIKD